MDNRKKFCSFGHYGYHKGFYNDEDPTESLQNIRYTDFFESSDDENPFYSAASLLRGGCDRFVLALKNLLGYNLYLIEGNDDKSFHAFCQIYKNGKWYYIDARGITSSFDEFMIVAKEFVNGEYTVRPVTSVDIDEWENYDYYNEEGYAFAEAVIKKYKAYYVLD